MAQPSRVIEGIGNAGKSMNDTALTTPAGATRLAEGVALQRAVRTLGEGAGRHTHDYHSVTVLLSSPGPSTWCLGSARCRSVRPAAGDVFFCPAHVPIAVRSQRACECVLLCLSPAFLGRVADRLEGERPGGVAPAVMRRDPFVRHVVTSLAEEAGREKAAGRELLASSLATALGVHLIREYAGRVETSETVARLPDDELDRLRRHIDRNLDSPLRLDDLASLTGRSRFHFSRLFKSSTGMTPHQYVIRRRVERARELLRAGAEIVEVAVAVGFASQSHLTFHIRRAFGCTPGQLVNRP